MYYKSVKDQIKSIDQEINRKKMMKIKLSDEIYDLIDLKYKLQYGKPQKNPNIFLME